MIGDCTINEISQSAILRSYNSQNLEYHNDPIIVICHLPEVVLLVKICQPNCPRLGTFVQLLHKH